MAFSPKGDAAKKKEESINARKERTLREIKTRGYSDELRNKLEEMPLNERERVLNTMELRSVTPPSMGFRVEYTKNTEGKAGIKPRKFNMLQVETPKTIFLFTPPKIAKSMSSRKSEEMFRKENAAFVKDREENSIGIGINYPDRISKYAIRKNTIEGELQAKKNIKSLEGGSSRTVSSIDPEQQASKGAKSRDPRYESAVTHEINRLRNNGVIRTSNNMTIQFIDLEKVKKELRGKGRTGVLVNDPEVRGSYMLFEMTKEGLKPLEIPASAVDNLHLGEISALEKESSDEVKKNFEEKYVQKLVESIEKDDVRKAIGRNRKKSEHNGKN